MHCQCGAVFFQLNLFGKLIYYSSELINMDFQPQNILLKIWLMKLTKHYLTKYRISNTVHELFPALKVYSHLRPKGHF